MLTSCLHGTFDPREGPCRRLAMSWPLAAPETMTWFPAEPQLRRKAQAIWAYGSLYFEACHRLRSILRESHSAIFGRVVYSVLYHNWIAHSCCWQQSGRGGRRASGSRVRWSEPCPLAAVSSCARRLTGRTSSCPPASSPTRTRPSRWDFYIIHCSCYPCKRSRCKNYFEWLLFGLWLRKKCKEFFNMS